MNYLAAGFEWLCNPDNWSGSSGILTRLLQHLTTTAIAVLIAAVIALPIGVIIGHTRRGSAVIGAIAGAARAIPTLGLLTLAALWLGIGLQGPLVALIVLAIPSMLAGAYAGIQSVDPLIPDSARAIGMSEVRIILGVEIPLGAPLIVGGIRAATLQVVATATLAAYVADNGLGRFLFIGLKTRDYPQMLAGALLVIALALVMEIVLAVTQRLVATRITRPTTAGRVDTQGRLEYA